jgi:hypothetical protein
MKLLDREYFRINASMIPRFDATDSMKVASVFDIVAGQGLPEFAVGP